MSLALKFFVLFLLVESSTAKNYWLPNQFGNEREDKQNQTEIDYVSIFRDISRGWQREADNKHPLYTSANYIDRSLFLQDKARSYVQPWVEWKNHTGYPFGYLRNKIQGDYVQNKIRGDLWPIQFVRFSKYCHEYEGKNLLTYLLYGLSAEADMV